MPVVDPADFSLNKDEQKAALGTDSKEGQLLTDDTLGYFSTLTLKDMCHPARDDLNAVPVPPSSSSESHPDSSDTQADGNSSGSAPAEQISAAPKGLPASQALPSPRIFTKSLARAWRVFEKNCGSILEGGAKTSETERKARDERKQENKEKDGKLFVKVRRSQRLMSHSEKEKAGKNIEKTLFTAEHDGITDEEQTRRSSGARQLCKREESNFGEQSQGTKITQTVERFSEMAKQGRHQRLAGEAGERCRADESRERKEKENNPSTTTPQEKSEKDEGSAQKKKERRKTLSKTAEEELEMTFHFVAEEERRGHQSEMKATPQRKTQGKVEQRSKEESISSPVKSSRTRRNKKGKDKVLTTRKAGEASVSAPISSGLHIDTPPSEEINKTENHPKQSAGSGSESRHHSSSPKPSPDKTSAVKDEGEDAEQPQLPSSPTKRLLTAEKMKIKTEILQSPMKRARLKISSDRAEDYSETRTGKGQEEETADI